MAEFVPVVSTDRAESQTRRRLVGWRSWLVIGSASGLVLALAEAILSHADALEADTWVISSASFGLTAFASFVLAAVTIPAIVAGRWIAARSKEDPSTRAAKLARASISSLMASVGAGIAAFVMVERTDAFQIRTFASALVSISGAFGAATASGLVWLMGAVLPARVRNASAAFPLSVLGWASLLGATSAWLIAAYSSLLAQLVIIPWLGGYACVALFVWGLFLLLPRTLRGWVGQVASSWWLTGVSVIFTIGCITSAAALLQGHVDAASYIASRHDPAALALRSAQRLTDFDFDGVSALFGGRDCAGFDGSIGPTVRDIPGNGIDENCDGRDATSQTAVWAIPDPRYRAIPESKQKKYNIILVCFDATRADHMGFMGYSRRITPYLDTLARESWVFENAIAPSSTTRLSIASVFTGRYPSGIEWVPRPRVNDVSPANIMLAELYTDAGYQTFAVVDEWLRRFTPTMSQGFSHYDGAYEMFTWREHGQHAGPFTTAMALDLLNDRNKDEPFLLYLHYEAPHIPYQPHPELQTFGPGPMASYDSEIRYADHHLGLLMNSLDAEGWLDDTIVVFFSDHGEEFLEHGDTLHGKKLYAESLHVPLLVRVPGEPPARYPDRVSLVDILPTLLDLTGAEEREGMELHGRSLLFTTLGHEPAPHRPIIAELEVAIGRPDRLAALYYDQYKLIWNRSTHEEQLFDVDADPGERTPLDDPEAEAEMHDRLQGILSTISVE